MCKISLTIILLFLSLQLTCAQSIGGERKPLGGQQYKYSYGCSPVKAEYGITCTIRIKNGKSNVSSFFLSKYQSNTSFKVTWDNITGTGSIRVTNPEGGTTETNVTIAKQSTTTTISENITNNRNISDCNVILTNAKITNNAKVNISAEESIIIKSNTQIESGTEVKFYLTDTSAYAINKMENDQTVMACVPCKAEVENKSVLFQNVPNPFIEYTVISCNIQKSCNNSYISIYNMMGELIKIIPLDASGYQEIIIGGSEFKPGFYSYSLIVNNQLISTKRMSVVN